jgi:drug/metabolite transporter (DMT)-like permease
VGVLIVLSPRLTVGHDPLSTRETLGAMVVLGGAVFAALAQVFVRKLVATEGTAAIVFWFSVTAVGAVAGDAALRLGGAVMAVVLMLVCAGLLGGVGQILLTSSYRHADASVIAPFEYASMLLALGIGYLLFDEVPTVTCWCGAAIIIARAC